MLLIGSATTPLLVTVTGCGVLATLINSLPKASDVDDAV
jgi:hypothetical protein